MTDYGGIAVPQNAAPAPSFDAPDAAPFWDVAGAAWRKRTVEADKWNYSGKLRSEMTGELYGRLDPASRQKVQAQMAGRRFLDPQAAWMGLVFEGIAAERAADPAKWQDAPADIDDAERRLAERRQAEIAEAQDILDLPGGGVAEFLGGAAREIVDPINLALMPFGLQGSAGRIIAGEAALGAVSEGLSVPTEQRVARELGLPEPSLPGGMVEGALFGGAFAGAFAGAGRFLSYMGARRAAARDTTPDGMTVQEAEARLRAAQNDLEESRPPSQVMADANGLPPVGPEAPPGWAGIRNGIFAGESGGDYNALFGFQNRRGGAFSRVRLTDMTVDQAIAFSDPQGAYARWVKGRIGRVATPMGAYQIVGTTLREAKRALGLRGNERMTPEFQEYLGQWVYRTQGTGAWVGFRGPRQAFTPADPGAAPAFATSRGFTRAGQVTAGDIRADVTYEVVDASLLRRASGDLQPRDRTRAASDEQVAEIAARLDPARLLPAPEADRGAPVVGPDNVIESGNGRVMAIARAYERHPDRAAAYRAEIEAAGFTVPEGADRPVLVARRVSDLDPETRRAFVREANNATVARMSPTERAAADAAVLSERTLSLHRPGARLGGAENRDFAAAALAALPQAERAALVDAAGGLNAEGIRRLQAALFARAWPAPDIVARFAEADAGELRGLLDALAEASPAWAALRAEIAAGRVRPEMDITGHVLDAMRMIAAAREIAGAEGKAVAGVLAELLDDIDLLEGAVSPLTAALVRKFWRAGRAAPKDEIAGFLTRYADEARQAGSAEAGLFGDGPGPAEVLRAIDRETFAGLPDEIGRARAAPAPVLADPQNLPGSAWAKGADSPEAEAADLAALEDLRALAADPGLAPEIAAARAENAGLGDLTFRLDRDGPDYTAAELLDDIEADEELAGVLALCNPGGAA